MKNLQVADELQIRHGKGIYVKENPLKKNATVLVFLPEQKIISEDAVQLHYFNILDELLVKFNKQLGLGYNILFFSEKIDLSFFRHHKVDGVLFVGVYPDAETIQKIKDLKIAYAIAGGLETEVNNLNFVDYDHVKIIQDVLIRLADNGHKKIGFFSKKRINKDIQLETEQVFFRFLYEHKLPINKAQYKLIDHDSTIEKAYEEMLMSVDDISAIYCDNPVESEKLFKFLTLKKGIAVPDDISLIVSGFSEFFPNNNDISCYTFNLNEYASTLLTSIETQLSGKTNPMQILLVPEWYNGKTIRNR